MRKVFVTIIILIIVVCVYILIKNSVENYPNDKFQFVGVSDDPPPIHHHNFDTKCFPRLPRPLYSKYHDVHMSQKLQDMEKCGECEYIEVQLVKEGKAYISCLHRDPNHCILPNVEKYRNLCKCEACHLLVDTWGRYFNNVANIVNFIETAKLPDPPVVEVKCDECKDVEKKCREYAEKIRNETECIIRDEKCKKVRIPTHKYNSTEKCCENVYNKWTLYTFDLMHIGDYVKCSR